jgi:hypothetical protein
MRREHGGLGRGRGVCLTLRKGGQEEGTPSDGPPAPQDPDRAAGQPQTLAWDRIRDALVRPIRHDGLPQEREPPTGIDL